MPICFGTGLHVSAISIVRHFTVSLWRVLHWLFAFFFLPQCKLIAMECSAYCLCPDFFHRTRCMYPISQTYDPVWSSQIGHQMRYREPKKLNCVSRCLIQRYFGDSQAECRIKHAWYSLIIILIQKYMKRMPICFTRNPVCSISIGRVGLQMRYREPKKLVFSGVYFKDILEICAHLQAECRIKQARYSLILIIKKKTKKITVQLLQATHTLQLCTTQ